MTYLGGSEIHGERKSVVSQQLQTRIGGISNRLLISPMNGQNGIGGIVRGCRFDYCDSESE